VSQLLQSRPVSAENGLLESWGERPFKSNSLDWVVTNRQPLLLFSSIIHYSVTFPFCTITTFANAHCSSEQFIVQFAEFPSRGFTPKRPKNLVFFPKTPVFLHPVKSKFATNPHNHHKANEIKLHHGRGDCPSNLLFWI